ncbi:MAG TPA: bifunctional 2-polyprenyl-6-hydroxyphenol methylase/3-demethylubiquinol 3-O-methyltransferase UbiG [Burkholderiaceae bacterium]|nr:bifunctional 2-polyprenyl-6-hydroxyphenol methylase/3-demethylubiquinol 3-O-methyltransferase UbiG [Burkholderiaceae bacterium]
MASNVDAAELQKFGDLAQRWWDPAGAMRPLHEMNPLRLDWIDRHAGLSGKRVVDVGCGGGILAESMAARGAEVLGIDLSPKPLRVAELHARESGARVDYREIDAEALAADQPGMFEVVTCMEMLEHVPDPAQTVAACARLVKPGGWVFVSTLNRNAKSFLLAIVGAEYVLGLLPKGTHEYEKFIRPSELAAFARAAGLEIAEMTGMTYNPLTRRFKLGSDADVNYMVALRKPA